jgi:hypothetical protein
VVTIPESVLNGNGNGSGTVYGTATGTEDVIEFDGLGNGNGSHGPLGAPTYDPPADGESDEPDDD